MNFSIRDEYFQEMSPIFANVGGLVGWFSIY